jgi:thiamine-monophosphate kinase
MGDDVAALRWPGGAVLLTTDALSEGTHFGSRSPPEWVGRATVSASLSDLASKGGRPVAFLLDLLLPPGTPPAWAKAVVRGAERAAADAGSHVVGGDTKSAASRSVIGTAIGAATSVRIPRRDGARPGDVVLVTGTVGRGGARAISLRSGRAPTRRQLVDLLRIEPRLDAGRSLAPLARTMIDTSDGIADAARRVARASGVRIVLDPERFPWDPRLRRIQPLDRRLDAAFYGGDYELLATVPRRRLASALAAGASARTRLSVVGAVESGRGAFYRTKGGRRPLPPAGWDPFDRRRPGASVRR